MRNLMMVAAVAVIGLSPRLVDAEAPVQKPDPALERLLAQLGSEDFVTRDAAAKQLRAAGPRALAVLRKGVENDDPEVSRQARRC